MTLDTFTIPAADIRHAVHTIADGLIDHQIIPAEDWDLAVSTLARAHGQVGGRARRHLYEVFAAALPTAQTSDVAEPLGALNRRLTEHAEVEERPASAVDASPGPSAGGGDLDG